MRDISMKLKYKMYTKGLASVESVLDDDVQGYIWGEIAEPRFLLVLRVRIEEEAIGGIER